MTPLPLFLRSFRFTLFVALSIFCPSSRGQTIHDVCETSLELESTQVGSTVNALTEQDAINFCGDNLVNSPSVWYKWKLGTGLADRIIQLSTCSNMTDFDTVITVYQGECDNLQCLNGNNDDSECSAAANDEGKSHSTFSFTPMKDQIYHITIHGSVPNETGTFELTLDEIVPIGGDTSATTALQQATSLALTAAVMSSLMMILS